MRRSLPLIALAGLLAACTSSGGSGALPTTATGGTEPRPPEGQACTTVLSKPTGGSAEHVQPPARVSYPDAPPTSGKHYGRTVPAGIYSEPIQDEIQVHNLEHGHVIVQYDGLTDAELSAVRQAVQVDPLMMVMAPRPTLEGKLALTAWGKIQTCGEIPDDVGQMIRAFVAANRDKAPESIP